METNSDLSQTGRLKNIIKPIQEKLARKVNYLRNHPGGMGFPRSLHYICIGSHFPRSHNGYFYTCTHGEDSSWKFHICRFQFSNQWQCECSGGGSSVNDPPRNGRFPFWQQRKSCSCWSGRSNRNFQSWMFNLYSMSLNAFHTLLADTSRQASCWRFRTVVKRVEIAISVAAYSYELVVLAGNGKSLTFERECWAPS